MWHKQYTTRMNTEEGAIISVRGNQRWLHRGGDIWESLKWGGGFLVEETFVSPEKQNQRDTPTHTQRKRKSEYTQAQQGRPGQHRHPWKSWCCSSRPKAVSCQNSSSSGEISLFLFRPSFNWLNETHHTTQGNLLCTVSTDLNVNLILSQKHLEKQFDQMSGYHGLAKLTNVNKINHHNKRKGILLASMNCRTIAREGGTCGPREQEWYLDAS